MKAYRGTYGGQSILSPSETIINSVLKEVGEILISLTKSTRNSGTVASERISSYHEVKISQTLCKNLKDCAE